MSLQNRYLPSHPQGQSCLYFLDFSNILPPGVGIADASLAIQVNSVPPTPSSDFTLSAVAPSSRRAYANLLGGVAARDYRLQWAITDTLGNTWIRTCLLLCAATS